MIRSADLCAGAEDGQEIDWARAGCDAANIVRCGCGVSWEEEDPSAPGKCPSCGGHPMVVERCDKCPLYDLDWARSHSVAGRILDRALHLDFLAANFKLPWDGVSAEQVTALRILREERDQYQREMAEENRPDL